MNGLGVRIGAPGSAALPRRFGIDRRALAALRIALGIVIVCDLAMRSRDLEAFYTDAGVLPTERLAETFPALASVSIHARFGSTTVQAILFAVSGLAAVSLLAGYRTTLATACSWILLASLYARNPYVVNGGDTILVTALVLCLCCPLADRWSVDAVRTDREPDRTRVRTLASTSLLGLVVLIYASNALLRFRSEWWRGGDAVRLVFELDQYTVLLGPTLAQFEWLLVGINYGWMGLLAISPLLALLTGPRRAALVAAYGCVHLGMLATLRLGTFPLVMVALLLPFLPASVWDRVERVAADPLASRFGRVTSALQARSGGSREGHVPWNQLPIGPVTSPGDERWRRRIRALVVSLVFLAATGWQAAVVADADFTIGGDDGLDPTEHGWAMFAPNPPEADGWYVVPGALDSGERVDAFHGGTVDWDRPPDTAGTYPTALWHRYLTDLRSEPRSVQREFGAYICRRAPERVDGSLDELEAYYVRESIALDETASTDRTRLFTVTC